MAVLPIKKKQAESPARSGQERNLETLRREMNRLMNDFFGGRGWLTEGLTLSPMYEALEGFSPRVDVADHEKEYRVTAELPGMKAADIDVSFTDNVLSIRGEKKTEEKEDAKDYVRTERSYGSFYRSIPFDVHVDEDNIKAEYKDGVLSIHLPKNESAVSKSKKISIKS